MGYGGVLGSVNSLLFGAPPKTPDLVGLATPTQNNPYGQSSWVQGPDGKWTQNVNFTGPMQDANNSLMTQWGQNAANGYGTGDDARNQSRDAAWSQFQRMSDPLMSQRENKSRSDLLNMGVDIGSEAYTTGMGNTLQANDNLRLNAMDQAVAAGDRAQGQTFNQNRQAWMDPLNAMGEMNSLLTMPNASGLANAGNQQFGAEMDAYNSQMSNITGLLNGAGSVAGAIGGMPSMGGLGGGFGGGSTPGTSAYGGSLYSPGQLRGPNFG